MSNNSADFNYAILFALDFRNMLRRIACMYVRRAFSWTSCIDHDCFFRKIYLRRWALRSKLFDKCKSSAKEQVFARFYVKTLATHPQLAYLLPVLQTQALINYTRLGITL